jgi:hypothetical protein
MWRYYVAATAIVAAFVFLIAHKRAEPPDLRISARASGTPSVSRPESHDEAPEGSVRGDAPWALSALPDCARQDRAARGNWAEVRAKIPAGASPVQGEFGAGPCTIRIDPDGIHITRGADRLRIPAPARLFVAGTGSGERYYLYRRLGELGELREYTLRSP